MPVRHGSESYFVLGEGLLTESEGGRQGTEAAATAATASTTVADTTAQAATPSFRFSRIGPKGARLNQATMEKLAIAMTAGDAGPSTLPAGFTYLGQFVDHDLSFDKTSVALGDNVAPAELLQARSPSLSTRFALRRWTRRPRVRSLLS